MIDLQRAVIKQLSCRWVSDAALIRIAVFVVAAILGLMLGEIITIIQAGG